MDNLGLIDFKLGFYIKVTAWTDFPGGLGGGGGVNTPPPPPPPPPENVDPPPPEISLDFNIPNYSLDYFTTMKLFQQLKHSLLLNINLNMNI